MSEAEKRFSQENKRAFRNPWVIGWLVLVFVVLAVNAGMVTTAVMTNPGLVEENYYEKGRDHEQAYQERLQARSELGWQVALEVPERIVAGRPDLFRFVVEDKHGVPIKGAHAVLTAYRPSDAAADFIMPLDEVAPGRYDGYLGLPLKGIWDLKLRVTKGEHEWDLSRRISVSGE